MKSAPPPRRRAPVLLGLGLLSVSAVIACGAVRSDGTSQGQPGDAGTGNDTGSGEQNQNSDGGVSPNNVDGSVAPVDAGPPNAQCPAQWEVYGDQDASDNLGGVNPTLISMATCTAAQEQDANLDGGFGPTDFTVTYTQSAVRSGMFMATLHQTTPFPYDLSVCLEPDGPNTGGAPTTPGGNDGIMILTNVPEDSIPYAQYPKVVLFTNFKASTGPDQMDVYMDASTSFFLGEMQCTYTKN